MEEWLDDYFKQGDFFFKWKVIKICFLSFSKFAAAAKSLQSCATLCDPRDGSPQGSPVPGILQARTVAWVAISFSSAWKWKVKVKSLSRVRLLATQWIAAHQVPPSMGFSRQKSTGVGCHCLLRTFRSFYGINKMASLITQLVKNLPAMQKIPVWFLAQEDPLEKG